MTKKPHKGTKTTQKSRRMTKQQLADPEIAKSVQAIRRGGKKACATKETARAALKRFGVIPKTSAGVIIDSLNQLLCKCNPRHKAEILVMHPLGFGRLQAYARSTCNVHEYHERADGPMFHGLKVVENCLLKERQYVVMDKDKNVLYVGSL